MKDQLTKAREEIRVLREALKMIIEINRNSSCMDCTDTVDCARLAEEALSSHGSKGQEEKP